MALDFEFGVGQAAGRFLGDGHLVGGAVDRKPDELKIIFRSPVTLAAYGSDVIPARL